MGNQSLELARLMAVYSYETKIKNCYTIGTDMGATPITAYNAFFKGEQMGLFTVVRNKKGQLDKLEVSDEQYASIANSHDMFGENIASLADTIVEYVSNINTLEKDIELGELNAVITGNPASPVPPAVMFAALRLATERHLTDYTIADSKDKKSSYRFLTLKGNEVHKWGKKQLERNKKK